MSLAKPFRVNTRGVVVLEFESRIVPRTAAAEIVPGLQVGVASIVSVALFEMVIVSPFAPEMLDKFVSVVTLKFAI
jgi:hypothetical protein